MQHINQRRLPITMQILFVTDSGCETACGRELKRFTNSNLSIGKNVVQLECTLREALAISYHIQTARRAIALLGKADRPENLEGPASDTLDQTISKGMTWKVDAEVLRLDENADAHKTDWDSHSLIEHVAKWSCEHLQGDVNLKNPDRTIYALLTSEGIYVGVDIAGRIAKRDWRIMLSRRSLKATIAAAAAIYADLKEEHIILDPLADDGTLAIEASLLLSGISPRKHQRSFLFSEIEGWKDDDNVRKTATIIAMCDTLKDLKAVRTNSKLAGVADILQSTRVTVDWMDLKIEEGSVDRILTYPKSSGKALPESAALEALDKFCNQAAWLLKPNGRMTCVMRKPSELKGPAQKYGFSLIEEQKVLMGQLQMSILCFEVG